VIVTADPRQVKLYAASCVTPAFNPIETHVSTIASKRSLLLVDKQVFLQASTNELADLKNWLTALSVQP
jgi:hypothetical protein